MAATHAIVGARIRTMNPDSPWATAVAWDGDTIVAVGSDAEVREVCDGSTQVEDAHGAAITPGIIDGHQHLFHGSEFAQGVSLDRANSLDELRERISKERKRIGPNAWLMGYAMEYAALEGAQYHHELLDAAAGEGPMLLWALDVHTAFVNAKALEIARLTGPVTLDDGSIVVVDADDKPTGELKEMRAIELVFNKAPKPSRDDRLRWYAEAIAMQNAVGITEIHNMDGNVEAVDVLEELEGRGDLNMRVLLHHFVYPYTDQAEVEAMIQTKSRKGRRWQADGVKFMLDGVIDTGTAWLEEPDSHGEGLEPMWPDLSLYHSRANRFNDEGFRIATHAIGDRAVREVLDTYAAMPGGSAGRHRIEHIETAPDVTMNRFKGERVTASMQPIHLRWIEPNMTDPWSQRLDHQRCAHGMRSGDLSAAGALVVLGSDWPVAPFDPRMGFFAAQLRRAHDVEDPRPVGASRPLTGEEMIAGYTVNSAKAVGASDHRGMLKVGLQADLVMWAEDPATCSPHDVIDLPVLQTVVSGQTVFRKS